MLVKRTTWIIIAIITLFLINYSINRINDYFTDTPEELMMELRTNQIESLKNERMMISSQICDNADNGRVRRDCPWDVSKAYVVDSTTIDNEQYFAWTDGKKINLESIRIINRELFPATDSMQVNVTRLKILHPEATFTKKIYYPYFKIGKYRILMLDEHGQQIEDNIFSFRKPKKKPLDII